MTNMPRPPGATPVPPRSGSGKLLLFAGLGCLGVLLLGGCIVGGAFVYLTMYSPSPAITSRAVAAGTTYRNEPSHLNANLRSNYVPFSFEYPADWAVVERGDVADDSHFVKVEKQDSGKTTIANFAVGWFEGAGSLAGDKALYSELADKLADQFSGGFSDFRKTSSGAVTVTDNDYEGYQFLFTARVNDSASGTSLPILGRIILVSGANAGQKNGVVLVLLATNKSGMTRPDELGESGDLGDILDSFTFEK